MPQTRARDPNALLGFPSRGWRRVSQARQPEHTSYVVKDPAWWLMDWEPIGTTAFVDPLLSEASTSGTFESELFGSADAVVSTATSVISFWEVLSHYVNRVAEIPTVRLVALSQPEEGDAVWTVISAPQFEDSYRRPVYDAQSEAIRLADTQLFTFRVINIEEMTAELADTLPEGYVALFERTTEP